MRPKRHRPLAEPDDPRHGSYRGAMAHYEYGEKPCEACRLALNAYQRQRLAENPAMQTAAVERNREWRARNPELARAQSRKSQRDRRKRDPDAIREARRKWEEANPGRRRRPGQKAAWFARNPEQYVLHRATVAANLERKQASTRSGATRHYTRWTPAEDAIAADETRTVVEAAQDLGRTYAATAIRRQILRKVHRA